MSLQTADEVRRDVVTSCRDSSKCLWWAIFSEHKACLRGHTNGALKRHSRPLKGRTETRVCPGKANNFWQFSYKFFHACKPESTSNMFQIATVTS